MFNILAQFNHKAEIRESKDEILVGEIVAAMANAGYPSIAFRAHNDRQLVRFKAINDCLLYTSPSPRDGRISRMPSSA